MAAQRLAGLAIAPVGTGESIRLWQELRPGAPVVAVNASADADHGRLPGPARTTRAAVELPMRRLADARPHLGRVPVRPAPPDGRPGPAAATSGGCAGPLGLRGTVMYSPLTIADVQQAAAVLLARPDAPTAIITNSDYTAHAIYKAARELRLRVGPDVSVVGHDDLPTSELLDPPLATIRLDRQEMGRALMRRLLGEVPPDDYIAPVELIERASLQSPAQSPARHAPWNRPAPVP